MAMTDWTGADAPRVARNRGEAPAKPIPEAAGVLPRGIALAIDYVILLSACAGLQGILGMTGLGADLAATIGSLLSFALIVFYFAALESGGMQATIGKRIMGVRVTDDEGRRISIARALGRFFAKLLSLIPFGIGFVMAAFTERHRALHDMLAGTLVVRGR